MPTRRAAAVPLLPSKRQRSVAASRKPAPSTVTRVPPPTGPAGGTSSLAWSKACTYTLPPLRSAADAPSIDTMMNDLEQTTDAHMDDDAPTPTADATDAPLPTADAIDVPMDGLAPTTEATEALPPEAIDARMDDLAPSPEPNLKLARFHKTIYLHARAQAVLSHADELQQIAKVKARVRAGSVGRPTVAGAGTAERRRSPGRGRQSGDGTAMSPAQATMPDNIAIQTFDFERRGRAEAAAATPRE